MMSRHFGLNSELPGAMVKRLPHAKNQLSMPGSFFNQFVTEIYIYTSALRLLALRGWWTICAAGGSLRSPGVTLVNYKGNSISKYVCPTVIIDITRKITKFVNYKNFDV